MATSLVVLGDAPVLNEAFITKTCEYFTKPGDVRRAFNTYLENNNIYEKPYYLNNGFQLKSEFKMEVVNMSDAEMKKTYKLKRK